MWLPPRKSVFLDFVSTENNAIYGTYANYQPQKHVQCLKESLNVAVLLCGDYCILPPFFPLQCSMVREALRAKSEFFSEGLIRLPLREAELGDFVDKKRQEYDAVRVRYSGLYRAAGETFLRQHSSAVIRRSARLGQNIAANWEAGPDESPAWKPLTNALSAQNIEILRRIPSQLKEEGKSVTLAAMQEQIPSLVYSVADDVQIALQHDYTGIYLVEYDASIITRIPPKTTDLYLQAVNLSYDYLCFRKVLSTLGLWRFVPAASAPMTIALRSRYGYKAFIHCLEQACLSFQHTDRIVRFFGAIAFYLRNGLLKVIRDIDAGNGSGKYCQELAPHDVNLIEEYLVAVVDAAREVGETWAARENVFQSSTVFNIGGGTNMPKVFIVHGHDTSVKNEIEIFLRRNNLDTIVMSQGAMMGRTLPEKFESMAKGCDYAVIIATPDDQFLCPKTNVPASRFRQNVVLEIGYFWGCLGREGKFSILVKGDPFLELPSDLQGLGYIEITDDLGETKLRLLEELRNAGVL